MNVGITVLIIVAVVTLSQMIVQGMERRKQHQELMDRINELMLRCGSED